MTITIRAVSPDLPEATALLAELDAHLMAHPYPQESRHAFNIERLLRENVAFFVAKVDGQPAGCGGIKLFGQEYGEIKRMYVRPAFRGRGLGKAMLAQLTQFASQHGIALLRLETGIYETEAIGMYESFGFRRCPPFGDYHEDPNSIYFEKATS